MGRQPGWFIAGLVDFPLIRMISIRQNERPADEQGRDFLGGVLADAEMFLREFAVMVQQVIAEATLGDRTS